ncbi:MAG: family 16 glycosylhydrolase [Planctomycetota bacterium]|jgi:hypothetical protein
MKKLYFVLLVVSFLFLTNIFGVKVFDPCEAWGEVIFREDFETPEGQMPDPNVWVVNDPNDWWRLQGRSFFPSPVYHPDAPLPRVENGVCVIEHHHYNPWHLGFPKTTFIGGEIHTIRQFEPNISYLFEARVRCDPNDPNGLVTSFFTYGYDGSKSDEIDFEFLSNMINDNLNDPNGDPVLVNTWNESFQQPSYIAPDGLDLSEWNVFRIYWYPAESRIDWSWVDPVNGVTLLRNETDAFYIPDEPMSVYFNFWASTDGWEEAYDPNLNPVSDPCENEIYRYEIDYVEVRTIECMAETHPDYLTWSTLAGTPDCWCYCKQCNGDINACTQFGGAVDVYTDDLAIFLPAFGDTTIATTPGHPGWCADLDRGSQFGGLVRVYTDDLDIFLPAFGTKVQVCSGPGCSVPGLGGCDSDPLPNSEYNFWVQEWCSTTCD